MCSYSFFLLLYLSLCGVNHNSVTNTIHFYSIFLGSCNWWNDTHSHWSDWEYAQWWSLPTWTIPPPPQASNTRRIPRKKVRTISKSEMDWTPSSATSSGAGHPTACTAPTSTPSSASSPEMEPRSATDADGGSFSRCGKARGCPPPPLHPQNLGGIKVEIILRKVREMLNAWLNCGLIENIVSFWTLTIKNLHSISQPEKSKKPIP